MKKIITSIKKFTLKVANSYSKFLGGQGGYYPLANYLK